VIVTQNVRIVVDIPSPKNQSTQHSIRTMKTTGRIEHDGFTYWYERRLAKEGELCLSTTDPEKYCNGPYRYSSKDPGDGIAFVIVDTDNIDLIMP